MSTQPSSSGSSIPGVSLGRLQVLLETAARLANNSPRVDLPHIMNAIVRVCYAQPAFLEMPPATQQGVLTWISGRVLVRTFPVDSVLRLTSSGYLIQNEIARIRPLRRLDAEDVNRDGQPRGVLCGPCHA